MATKFEVLLSAKLDSNSVNDIQKQLDSISKGTKLKIDADDSSVKQLKQSLTDLGSSAKEAKALFAESKSRKQEETKKDFEEPKPQTASVDNDIDDEDVDGLIDEILEEALKGE